MRNFDDPRLQKRSRISESHPEQDVHYRPSAFRPKRHVAGYRLSGDLDLQDEPVGKPISQRFEPSERLCGRVTQMAAASGSLPTALAPRVPNPKHRGISTESPARTGQAHRV